MAHTLYTGHITLSNVTLHHLHAYQRILSMQVISPQD